MYAAELHGKLALDAGTPADRTEDTLTAAVFGALRYLPRRVLLAVLDKAFPGDFCLADIEQVRFEFWPWLGEAEPDVLLTVGKKLVVVEAKYGAAFSGAGGSPESHQLAREYRGAWDRARARRLEGPWVLAVTADWAEPSDVAEIRGHLQRGVPEAVRVEWMAWQSVAGLLDRVQAASVQEQDLLTDVLRLMDRRGVRRVFEGFREEDYWIVSAAQRVAAERVYPAIATFAHQLNGQVGEVGLRWGPNDKGVLNYHSMSLQQPEQWARSYIQLPYWAENWPRRQGFWATLYVIFDFLDGSVAIGYLQKVPSVAAGRQRWLPAVEAIASAVQSLPEPYQVAFSDYNYARSRVLIPAADLTADVVRDQVQRQGANLRLEQRLAARDLQDVGQAAKILAQTKTLIDERPELFSVIMPLSASAPEVVPAELPETVVSEG
jgi:hypothetical protein